MAPGSPLQGAWEVSFAAAGKYKIKAQYKLPDRTVQSNSVKVEVGSTVESARTTAR
jgi:hypothetical protein